VHSDLRWRLRPAFPDQADNPLDTTEEQGALQSQILPMEFEMTLLIRRKPETVGNHELHGHMLIRFIDKPSLGILAEGVSRLSA
jgi:hypothetical protein